jgi:membrane fusion protein, multidrug efflux system
VRRLRLILIGLVAAAAALGGWYYYRYESLHPSTEDAYVGRHVVQMAAQVSGPAKAVPISDNQRIAAGALLLTIDPAPFEIAVKRSGAQLREARSQLASADAQVKAAEAKVSQAEANYINAKRHAERVLRLVKEGTETADRGDAAIDARDQAQGALTAARADLIAAKAARGEPGENNAAVKAAEAALAQAQLDLKHTRLFAPAAGRVGNFDLRPGSYITSGQPLFALVEDQEVWVDANFKETDLTRIRAGQPATVAVDMLPGRTFQAVVESISPASGTSFSLLPPENATGNWVKVTQRFPVRVRILHPVPALRVGASSSVTVDTTGLKDGGN